MLAIVDNGDEAVVASTEAVTAPPSIGRKNKRRRRDRVRLQEGSHIREPGSNDPETEPFTNGTRAAAGSAAAKPNNVTMLGLSSAFDLVKKVSDKMSSKKQEHPLKRRASRRARVGSVRRAGTGSRNKRQSSIRSGSQSSATGTLTKRPNGQLGRGRLILDADGSLKKIESSSGGSVGQKGDVEAGIDTAYTKPSQKTVKDHVLGLIYSGWRQFQVMIGARHEEIITVQEIIKEPILEDLDMPHRYRPENLQLLCEATGFSVVEMKRIYRGFKTECPTGLITEEAFHGIYSRFFPQGANISSYSHYIFSTLDHEDSGIITFEDFVIGLSILVRGTVEEKVRWMFSLYDQDRDGYISREEMEDVVGSVFDLMGRTSDPILEEEVINERVDYMFERMDLNGDGMVSLEEFLETCLGDEHISRSIVAFSNVII